MVRKEHLIGLGAFVVLLCLMVVLYSVSKQPGLPIPMAGGAGTYTQHSSQGYGSLTIQVSDPSFLPKGTSALVVTFSNASVYSQTGGWINGSGYGPVNIDLQANQSVTISSVGKVPYNSIISAARLGVKSTFMVVNGTSYNVSFSGNSISTNLTSVNFGSGRALLLVLSPFVAGATGTSEPVRLGYSSRGYIINGSGGYVGQTNRVALAVAKPITPYANISIKNAVVTTKGKLTTVKIEVVNHSGKPVRLGSVALLGKENITRNDSAIASLSSSYADAIVQKYVSSVQTSSSSSSKGSNSTGSSLIGSLFNTSASGASAGINPGVYSQALNAGASLTNIVYSNISALTQLAGPIPKSLLANGGSGLNVVGLKAAVYNNIYSGLSNASVSSSNFQSNMDSVAFAPSQDGALGQSWSSDNSSYYLQPDSNATLTYTGQLSLDNTTSIGLVPNDSYQVMVSGDNGTTASYGVNSTG